MTETIGVPVDDRFLIITEHDPDGLVYDSIDLGIRRTDAVVLIRITISHSCTVTQRQYLYARIPDLLADRPALRREDIFVNQIEVSPENCSFGNGVAQYAAGSTQLPAR